MIAALVACGGSYARPERMEDPDRTSFAGYRAGRPGCISLAAFAGASAAERAAAAKRHARTAAAHRNADARLVIALRLATTGTSDALAYLQGARAVIDPADDTTDRHERAIRGAHAMVERAHAALLDALSGAATALERIGDDDPALEPLGAFDAHVRDLDERVRVLLVAFEAFEFSEDLDRLSRIVAALTEALADLPAPALQARLDALRAALAAL